MAKPLAVDLFCGLGGWSEGLMAEGWDVVGFDIEQRPYPAQLVLQDVLTLHGSQFRNADLIVASPPCQAYSYRAMPWKRAKALPPPDNALFEACFRIQLEACEAAGRHIPLIVENVKGAQPWVGRAKWHYGSFYLWGDVPALMPVIASSRKGSGGSCFYQNRSDPRDMRKQEDGNWSCSPTKLPGQNWSNFNKTGEVSPHWNMQALNGSKNSGGSWFAVAHNTGSGIGNNPDGRKVQHHLKEEMPAGTGKTSWFFGNTKHELRAEGVKQGGEWWHDPNGISVRTSSRSSARKHASAVIAKIPFPLASHIARVFYPEKLRVSDPVEEVQSDIVAPEDITSE